MIHAVMVLLLFAATPAGMAPLPDQYLNNGTFSSPDGWFAVHTPDGSEWFEMRKFDGDADPRWPDGAHDTVAWYVRGAKMSGTLLVMETYHPVGEPLSEPYAQGLEVGVRRALEADETISNFSYQIITTPVEGIRYTYKKTKKDGSSKYLFWYVTGMEHKVFMEASAPANDEPKWLRGVVQSFRWIKMP